MGADVTRSGKRVTNSVTRRGLRLANTIATPQVGEKPGIKHSE